MKIVRAQFTSGNYTTWCLEEPSLTLEGNSYVVYDKKNKKIVALLPLVNVQFLEIDDAPAHARVPRGSTPS